MQLIYAVTREELILRIGNTNFLYRVSMHQSLHNRTWTIFLSLKTYTLCWMEISCFLCKIYKLHRNYWILETTVIPDGMRVSLIETIKNPQMRKMKHLSSNNHLFFSLILLQTSIEFNDSEFFRHAVRYCTYISRLSQQYVSQITNSLILIIFY